MSKKLGETRPPRGLLRRGVRLPIWLYRARLGWLLGDRFLMLTQIGRKSGKPRQVVLEVVSHDKTTDTYVVASGWGEKSNWFRNIEKTPAVIINVSRRRFGALAVRLSIEEAERELCNYARRHPMAFRELSTIMSGRRLVGTAEDCAVLAQSVPLVAFKSKKY